MSRDFTATVRALLKSKADPHCEECDGDGVVCWTRNSDPTTDYELACACVEREPEASEHPEAWEGGFADNH